MPDFEERTEQATPQKRQKAREKGQVPRSKELTSMSISFIFFTLLSIYGGKLIFDIKRIMVELLNNLDKKEILSGLNNSFIDFVYLLFPMLIFAMSVGIIVSVLQGGFVIKPFELEFQHLNPVNGFQRIFSFHNLTELLKSILKILVGGIIFYIVLKKVVNEIPSVMKMDFQSLINQCFFYISKSTKYILFAFLILAVSDYGIQYWLFEKSIRMTKEEIKEEFKEQEGDPLVKSRIKSIQRELANRRMMQDVAKATVVITNPTHLAVALKYSKELQAPKIVAKGAEFLAEKIKEVARKNDVPIMEDKPLARALFKLDIGEYIPKELYRAVAKIIAFVYKQKKTFS